MTKELTIFHYAGKTYIGYFCNFDADDKPSFTGITDKIDDMYVFQGPAELSYSINITSDATADLTSIVMPLYPGDFMNGGADNIYFAFPKSQVIVSSIKPTNI